MTLKRGLLALSCLAAAASCAKMTEEGVRYAATPEAAAVPVPAAVGAPPSVAAKAGALDLARFGSVDSLADGRQESIGDASAETEAQLPQPSVSTPELLLTAPERPVIAAAAPARQEPARGPDLIASSVASRPGAATLDVTSLLKRLRKTKAINLRTKLAVKSESDDLMERFRAYHAQHGTATLAELRRSYDSLVLKLYSLLEDADPPLARDIDRSRAAIWAILADPMKFGASAPTVSTRGDPPPA
jgi:hypothetical protein